MNHPQLKRIDIEAPLQILMICAERDLADMESPDLKNELLIDWAQPAFMGGSLQVLGLKTFCLWFDNKMHDKIYKDYNFLIKHKAFILETAKTIVDSVEEPQLFFPYFTKGITGM